jgi:NAD-dependent oxidoreductase involved in siderophore biosynthesis
MFYPYATFFCRKERTMAAVATLIWIILGTTLAGVGLTIVIATPSLAADSMKYIPWGALGGFVIAMPLSLLIARQIAARRA